MSKLLVPIYIIATSLALIFVKLGTESGFPVRIIAGRLEFNLNFFNLVGIALYGLSFVMYIYLISKNDLGYIIPLTTAFVYIIIFVASYFIFKESFTVLKATGIALILGGLVLLNLGK